MGTCCFCNRSNDPFRSPQSPAADGSRPSPEDKQQDRATVNGAERKEEGEKKDDISDSKHNGDAQAPEEGAQADESGNREYITFADDWPLRDRSS
mmetsp:Transcript_2719/g.5236  ORF Transcript_2719/g.5236 Transcript_2719/m.5236 type:complete len:95 (+) Transcript_2719:99-383(+)